MRFFGVVAATFLFAIAVVNGQSSLDTTSTPPFAASAEASSLEISNLPQHLDAARYALHVENGVLSGPGAAVLTDAIAHSMYILIGEDHFTREVPEFATAICNLTTKQGPLTGMAMEVSPEASAFMMRIVNSPDRWQRMVAQVKAYPWSIAFLDSRQEDDMVAACAHASHNPNFHLWGLDQTFLGSAGWLIDMMLAAKPGPEARAALLRLEADEEQDAASARVNANAKALFLISQKGEVEIEEAKPAINHDGGAEVKRIFDELSTSYHIYRDFSQGDVDADAQRAKLLKLNFRDAMNRLTPSERAGKVIVKFGASHLYKGVNDAHDLNLGNYIAETAEMEGQGSVNICVLGAGGTVSAFGKYGQLTHTEEDPPMKDRPLLHWMEPFKAAALPGKWTLYDLRELRYKVPGPLDSEVRRILDGYDFLVIVPKFTAAEMAD